MKKKRDWDIIAYPLTAFAILFLAPLYPTFQVCYFGANKLWLILTIAWALSWYIGLAVWKDEHEKRK